MLSPENIATNMLFALVALFILPTANLAALAQAKVPTGVKARVSQKGINYIGTFLKDMLIDQIIGGGANNNNNNEEFQLQLNGSKARLTELRLDVPNKPSQLKSKSEGPRQALVEIPAIAFNYNAKLEGGTLQQQQQQRVQFRVTEATLFLNISATHHVQGAPNFRIERCQLPLIKPLTVTMDPQQNQTEVLQHLVEAGPSILEQLICSRIVFVLDEKVNQRFALIPSKLSLAHLNGSFIMDEVMRKMSVLRHKRADVSGVGSSAESNTADPEFSASFNVSRADSLFLDYTILDVRADKRGIEVDSSGEVSLHGRGGTPFSPEGIFLLPEQVTEEQMLQMMVSDYIPNSLLYHGHSIGLFNARVDPETPHFGPIMRTTCPASSGLLFCLGDLFPTLKRVHPDRALALRFITIQPPTIKFHPQTAGGITFSLSGRIIMNLLSKNDGSKKDHQQPEVEVAKMEINVDAHMRMRLSSTTVRPKVTLDKIALKTLSPGVLAQEELDRSVLLAREVLQRMVNDLLKAGIPIPVHPLLRLHKPKVKIIERALLLLTNLEFNEPLVRQITSASLERRRGRKTRR